MIIEQIRTMNDGMKRPAVGQHEREQNFGQARDRGRWLNVSDSTRLMTGSQ